MPLNKRRTKGSQLTWDEIDDNWAGRQRKRYWIEGRTYWADASELPGLVAAIVQRPPKVDKTVAKASQQPAKARKPAAAVPIAKPEPALVEARLERLEMQFRQMDDELLLRSLAIARQRLLDMEEEDIEMLVLA